MTKRKRSTYNVEDEEIYEVEEIMGHRLENSELQFLIKWEHYPTSCNTWEPVNNLAKCIIFKRFVDSKFESIESEIFINHVNIKRKIRKKLRKGLRQPKYMTMLKVQPFDPFEFKVNLVFYHLVPTDQGFIKNLKKQVWKNYFYKLDLVQRQQHDEMLRKLRMKEDISVGMENEIDFDPPPQFEYITENVLSDEMYIVESTGITGCKCIDGCSIESACCPKLMRQPFPYKSINGRTVLRLNRAEKIYECGDDCACGSECINRVSQEKKKIPLTLFKSENRGWGLKASANIPKGSFILEYVGELLGQVETNARSETAYLFDLNMERRIDNQFYTIDAFRYGNLSRFVNHSCAPNARIWFINNCHGDPKHQKLCFFSDRLIVSDEEITIDYSGGDDGHGGVAIECHCGAKTCKGYIY